MEDDAITYIEEDEITPQEIVNESNEIKSEFINGLPDWDLEPPYEIIKRSNL